MVPENEHKEKFNKPWSIWAYEKCRECQHGKIMHMAEGLKEQSAVVAQCNEIVRQGGFCSCPEYLPPDNLDYIELLAKRKGLIPEDENNVWQVLLR